MADKKEGFSLGNLFDSGKLDRFKKDKEKKEAEEQAEQERREREAAEQATAVDLGSTEHRAEAEREEIERIQKEAVEKARSSEEAQDNEKADQAEFGVKDWFVGEEAELDEGITQSHVMPSGAKKGQELSVWLIPSNGQEIDVKYLASMLDTAAHEVDIVVGDRLETVVKNGQRKVTVPKRMLKNKALRQAMPSVMVLREVIRASIFDNPSESEDQAVADDIAARENLEQLLGLQREARVRGELDYDQGFKKYKELELAANKKRIAAEAALDKLVQEALKEYKEETGFEIEIDGPNYKTDQETQKRIDQARRDSIFRYDDEGKEVDSGEQTNTVFQDWVGSVSNSQTAREMRYRSRVWGVPYSSGLITTPFLAGLMAGEVVWNIGGGFAHTIRKYAREPAVKLENWGINLFTRNLTNLLYGLSAKGELPGVGKPMMSLAMLINRYRHDRKLEPFEEDWEKYKAEKKKAA